MTIASGIFKKVVAKKESTWGTAAGASGAEYLRRVSSDLNLVKNTYESGEIRTDQQVSDMRHGIRRVEGTLNGELSPASYKMFMAAAMRKDFVAGVSAATLTITPDSGGKTFTRSSGSWLTDGFKVGDIVRYSGFTAGAAANNAINFRITALTATVMTVAEAVTTSTAQASITCAVTGKKTYVPLTSHTDDSFSIEHWFSDVAQSELFLGCKVNSMELAMPSTGMATIAMGFMGKDVTTGTAAYFTTPTAASESGLLTAVSGSLRVGSSDIAVITGANISIAEGMTPAEVAFTNSIQAMFPGRVRVSGQISAYFENATMRDAFLNESELAMYLTLTTGSGAAADFLNFVLPRIKVGGATKNDGEQGIIQTIPFTALLNTSGGAGISSEETTMSIQDSLA